METAGIEDLGRRPFSPEVSSPWGVRQLGTMSTGVGMSQSKAKTCPFHHRWVQAIISPGHYFLHDRDLK